MTPLDANRSARLAAALSAHSLDALIVTAATNIRYLTGFTGSNGTVLATAEQTLLITDKRYEKWAADEVEAHDPSVDILIAPGAGRAELLRCIAGVDRVGLEAAHVSWGTASAFQADIGPERVVPTTGVIEAMRELKTPDEIAKLRSAADVGDAALGLLVPDLRPGLSEVEVARQLSQHMFDHSGAEPSFDIIVATGPNSAKPHHEPTDRIIEKGDLLIIDSGATVDGYRSDMTRSFVFGAPTAQQQEMLDAVLVAQRAGVDAVAVGTVTAEIDSACRTSLTTAGLGDYFTHGTGHGVGLDIHEAPSVSSASTATLAPGHVITVEPGVYIPNVGGVRWEDTVVVTTTGGDALTRSPKQPLIEL